MSLVYYMSIVHGVLHPRPVMQSCPSHLDSTFSVETENLVKGVGPGAPPGEHHAETDSLGEAGDSADGKGVDGALLGEELADELRGNSC